MHGKMDIITKWMFVIYFVVQSNDSEGKPTPISILEGTERLGMYYLCCLYI